MRTRSPSVDTPARPSEAAPARPVSTVLLTPRPRNGTSGGHRYNDRLLAAAASSGFTMRTAPARLLRLPAADIAVVDSLEAWKLAIALGRRRRPRAIALVHQQPGGVDGARWRRRIRRVLDLATYRRCDLVVAAGVAVADTLRAEGISPTRVEVIPPGRDLPPSTHHPPLRAGRRIGALDVANWSPNKGIIELVNAVALLPHDDVQLHLAGQTDNDRDYEAAVTARLRQPDLEGRVVVHGAIDQTDVAALCAAADVFVFPSHVEAYGSAVAEALAVGLPVVGWRTPFMSALVDDRVEGLLVPAGDIAGLADAIHRLAIDPDLRASLSDGARRRAARLPTWEQTTHRFFGALRRIVTQPVEPAQRRATGCDVDPADGGVLDEQSAHRQLEPERPPDRGFDRTDVRDDEHH
jgi:glycosyltransferase involved in cell wall biosynthesis